MSKEEAIKELTELLPEEFLSKYTEAIKMGIEALEQEPCEDAVDRQAALDAMYELCDTGETLKENPWRDNPHIDAITDAINNLPSVTPQPKMGRWNFTKHYGRDYYVCSVCGMERMNDHSSGWNYCHYC